MFVGFASLLDHFLYHLEELIVASLSDTAAGCCGFSDHPTGPEGYWIGPQADGSHGAVCQKVCIDF